MGRKNSIIAKAISVALPVATLAAAHWFPWRKIIHRDLHQLEAYSIGAGAIVGTATIAMTVSDSECEDHVIMLWLAALSAGLITIAAHTIDHFVRQNSRISDQEAQIYALKEVLGSNEHNVSRQ